MSLNFKWLLSPLKLHSADFYVKIHLSSYLKWIMTAAHCFPLWNCTIQIVSQITEHYQWCFILFTPFENNSARSSKSSDWIRSIAVARTHSNYSSCSYWMFLFRPTRLIQTFRMRHLLYWTSSEICSSQSTASSPCCFQALFCSCTHTIVLENESFHQTVSNIPG